MNYLAITQATANWILGQPVLIEALIDLLKNESAMRALRDADLIEGRLRMSGTQDGTLCAIWNTDYLSGTGDEAWGVVRLSSPLGLLDEPDIAKKVFATELYLINSRLQGLHLDYSYIHRSYDDGSHTIRADRGEQARRMNLGYAESVVSLGSGRVHSLMVIGPAYDLDMLHQRAAAEGSTLSAHVKAANQLIMPKNRRAVLDKTLFSEIRSALAPLVLDERMDGFERSTIATLEEIDKNKSYETALWTYADWARSESPLSAQQRTVLTSDLLDRHPIRIIGPAGSGKSLVMQLLALKQLRRAAENGDNCRVLYIVHNAAMKRNMLNRFEVLVGESVIDGLGAQVLDVKTLSDYALENLPDLSNSTIIDVDAYETKRFQFDRVMAALLEQMEASPEMSVAASGQSENEDGESDVFLDLFNDHSLAPLYTKLIAGEISTAIKGHGLIGDKQRYVFSDKSLSRLHSIMGPRDRSFVFDVFRRYHHKVFEEYGVLDADDVAVSLLGRLRSPIWQLKRREQGYDYVFVDETQLFNENERRILPLLTKGEKQMAPIALAIDEAQELFGQVTAGFGTLGIEGLEEQRLPSNHRSIKSIVDLSFFMIEKTTDLFGPDFPRFTNDATATLPETKPKSEFPKLVFVPREASRLGRYVAKKVKEMRRNNLLRIAVVCHADIYWDKVESELRAGLQEERLPLRVLQQRGELLPEGTPLCVLARPAYVGGQEFDGVVAVGLEQGVTPPRITDNQALEAAVEQQALREMYLSFSRARHRLVVVINEGATPTKHIQEAVDAGFIRLDA